MPQLLGQVDGFDGPRDLGDEIAEEPFIGGGELFVGGARGEVKGAAVSAAVQNRIFELQQGGFAIGRDGHGFVVHQPVTANGRGRQPTERGEQRRSLQLNVGFWFVLRSTATSWRKTCNSASLDADVRANKTSQAKSRVKSR